MNAKTKLRGILPMTSRAEEARMSELRDALKAQSQEIDELRQRLDDLGRHIGRIHDTTELSRRTSQYVNPEYSAIETRGDQILLAGWYGADNLGDELMMRTVIHHMPESALSRTWVLLWDNMSYDYLDLDPRIHCIHYPRTLWELQALSDKFATLIWGGGAVLDDRQYSRDPFNNNTGNLLIHLSERMIAQGKKVIALGLSSSTELKNTEYLEHLDKVVRGSSHFSLRDENSLSLLEKRGVDCREIMLVNDIVFAMPELSEMRAQRASRAANGAPVKISFITLTMERRFEHYVKILENLGRAMDAIECGYEIVLVPFSDLDCEDTRLHQRLIDHLPSLPMRGAAYSNDVRTSELIHADFCVSYKYHGSLIADILGIPNISVYTQSHPHYKNKMTYLATLAHQESCVMSDADLEAGGAELLARAICKPHTPAVDERICADTRAWLVSTLESI